LPRIVGQYRNLPPTQTSRVDAQTQNTRKKKKPFGTIKLMQMLESDKIEDI